MKVKKSGDIIVQNGQYVEVLRTKNVLSVH